MVRSVLVPSRNSRHRIAALALYRALVKTGRNIPLPENLVQTSSRHPVPLLVRKRFAKNADYTSLRLVYASMAAGYKFLTLLTKGQTPNSPEHLEIVNHLQSLKPSATSHPQLPTQETELEHHLPLLTRVSAPNSPTKYASTVRPRSKTMFNGDRKVPHVVATAEGQPFLRDRKPQPRVLSKAIRRRDAVMVKNIGRIGDLEQEVLPAAMEEDNWDRLVRKQIKFEGLEDQERPHGPLDNYRWNAQLSRIWVERKIDTTWQDWVARGKALQQIVNQETALAEQESKGQSEPGGGTEIRHNDGPKSDDIQISGLKQQAPLNVDLKGSAFEDPYLSDEWMRLVQRSEAKQFKGDRPRGNNGTDLRSPAN